MGKVRILILSVFLSFFVVLTGCSEQNGRRTVSQRTDGWIGDGPAPMQPRAFEEGMDYARDRVEDLEEFTREHLPDPKNRSSDVETQ